MTTNIESVRQATVDLMESFQQEQQQQQRPGGGFTPKELYRLGSVLHQLDVMQAESIKHDVQTAYHQLLQDLPQRKRFFDVLHQGLDRLLHQDKAAEEDVLNGIDAMDSLYRFSVLAEASNQRTAQTLKSLAKYYHANKSGTGASCTPILSLIFRLLWKTPSKVSLEWEELLPVLEVLQDEGVWKPLSSHLDEIATGWQEAWLEGCEDDTQREYLSSWLKTAALNDQEEDAAKLAEAIARAQPSPKARPKKLAAAVTSADPLQRQLDQVRAVLPQFGEGLVELALSLRQGNVEETVALLSSPSQEWPATLRSVDPTLPRRHQKRVTEQDAAAKELTKEAIRAADEQEELEAMILTQFTGTADEYDDDYDDQWDALDTAGANDGGLYDDYQAVRTYNRVVRDTEKEAAFWEANANTNRKTTKPTGESRYRGPDKLKGGRVPKPPQNDNTNNNKKEDKKKEDKGGEAKTDSKKDAVKQQNSNEGKPSRAAQRQKDRKMANRKEKQRQSMNKRSGA